MDDYKKCFFRFIRINYPNESDSIITETDLNYRIISADTAFSKTSKNPIDRRLDFSSYFLAFIKTLDAKAESFENIRKICLQITTAYVQPKNKFHGFLKRLLPKLINTWLGQRLIKAFHNRISVNANADGFIANIITDRQQTFGLGYGIDIIECGICKLFQKHKFSKYASILCEVDEITSGLAGLQLIRTGTIANGAKKCDFRFKLKKSKIEESSPDYKPSNDMLKRNLLGFMILLGQISFGQDKLDLPKIEKLTTDSASRYFYPKLISEFQNHPMSLTQEEAQMVYYGSMYASNYKMFRMGKNEDKFAKLLAKQNYKEAVPVGEKLLEETPANLEVLAKIRTCYDQSGMTEEAALAARKVDILLKAIFESGTGKDGVNAFKVVAVGDEYLLMAVLGVRGLSRQSIRNGSSFVDSWKVKSVKTGEESELHLEVLANTALGFKNMKLP